MCTRRGIILEEANPMSGVLLDLLENSAEICNLFAESITAVTHDGELIRYPLLFGPASSGQAGGIYGQAL